MILMTTPSSLKNDTIIWANLYVVLSFFLNVIIFLLYWQSRTLYFLPLQVKYTVRVSLCCVCGIVVLFWCLCQSCSVFHFRFLLILAHIFLLLYMPCTVWIPDTVHLMFLSAGCFCVFLNFLLFWDIVNPLKQFVPFES